MKIYTTASEETLRASKLLKEWAGEGFLSEEQYKLLQQETVTELRTTNIFLRAVLFLFTLICVAAFGGLVYRIFIDGLSDRPLGIFLLIYAVVCYVAAEVAVSQAHFYRYGIEEALAVSAVGCLCMGIQLAFLSQWAVLGGPDRAQSLMPICGAVFSLWIWHRFGLWYAFAAAMVFTYFVPGYWTESPAERHVIVALFYAMGLICLIAVRSRHRVDYVEHDYSLAEAFLWFGIYLAINLQLSGMQLSAQVWGGDTGAASEFSGWFYWMTWVLIWVLPAVVVARGIRGKDRFIMGAGAITALLTLVTNKPYLGWPRHTWDPILLGVLLIGVAWLIRRWLARGPNGIRSGFTAARLSGKDKQWMNVSSSVLGLVTPQAVTPNAQAKAADFRFGGGASGGGGAGGEY